MRREKTPFVGGPLDGRVLPVVTGITGAPPRRYTVPVSGAAVLVYERVPQPHPKYPWLGRWRYEYRPDGPTPRTPLRWPWSRPPRDAPDPGPGAAGTR